MEMAVLPVRILDVGIAVTDRRGRQDRDPLSLPIMRMS
jgi:hypothetical protein